jgi:uncharacterized membrane protein YfcA
MTLTYVFASYLALGALAGTLAGMFGIGGGLIIVPVLIFSFGLQGINPDVAVHLAIGTTLAAIVFTSISSIRTHHQHHAVRWDIFWPMTVGIVVGALLGAKSAAMLSGETLQIIIGVFVILMAIKMLTGANPKPGRDIPGHPALAAVGGFIGWASAIFGIGGGSLTVPYLSWCNVRMQHTVGTSAACGLPIALAGAVGNIWTGWGDISLPDYSLGFIYLPALLGIILTSVFFARFGAALAHRLDGIVLKRIFAVILIVVGIRFLLS